MRLHHLEVTAFGPFADSVSIDFDRLSGAGLFLLSGATGAGKTSVLDAVCFALYGDVPGDRNTAKRLRADQAAPGLAPRVELEVTLSGRRFRIVRSPAWERAKKRGAGTTTQQASVTICEHADGEWAPLSSRLDETGHLISHLVGMNVTQFTQVAMLPQGRFQAFLRARSEERHKLLQQLFRTGRFEAVERWLRDRRIELSRRSEAAHRDVAGLVSRISEATDAEQPDDWDALDLTDWATGLRDHAVASRGRAHAVADLASGAEERARRTLEAARALADRRARHDAAVAEQALLLASSDAHDAAVARLAAARNAATVAPLHRLAVEAAGARGTALDAALTGTAVARDLLGRDDLDQPALAAAQDHHGEEAARVRAAQPRAARLGAVVRELAGTEAAQQELTIRIAATTERRDALPAWVAELRDQLDRSGRAVARTPAVEARLAVTTGQLTAHELVAELTGQLDVARADLAVAETAATSRREEWLDLREARLDGMAAEIAGALAVGACCPVCGSDHHPHKALVSPGAPDAAAEKAALRLLDDAKATEHLHDERVRDLVTRLAVARDNTGDVAVEDLRNERIRLTGELAELRADGARMGSLQHALDDAELASKHEDEALRRLEIEAGRLAATAAGQRALRDQLAAEVDALLDGTGQRDLDGLLELHTTRAAAAREARQALIALDAAEAALVRARAALTAAATEAGFASPHDAIGARLDPGEVDALAARTAEHDRRVAAVEAVLASPEAERIATAELPDPAVLATAHAATLEALGDARSGLAVWSTRVERLTALVAQLEASLRTWAPIRADLELTTRLSSFVEGKSPDNRLQMRLSAFVLAYRLSQVVAAANERLARMSDQRYSLEHTGRKGAGETRGGLSLLVRDDWSGESRDPATLSGGETFVVSLALALGLADVITQEAGGADLDTLFVDEGFGSLDADTLDDVMDTLDSLRDGGRVVGVVSHVAEMRDRIPTQLLVSKSRRGSTVAVRGSA
ncbi:MAG: sbcC [Nocardioides sp.]|nr:sbcC [Nocardioides sp.]